MQSALGVVERWCSSAGLACNPAKTEMLLFTRRRKLDGYRSPKFFGRELSLSKQVKFLGVTLDPTLNWGLHVTSKVEKATRALWALRRAVGRRWGLSPRVTHWIYTAIIRPMLLYASLVWWEATEKEVNNRKLQTIQRMACRFTLGGMRTTPTAAMETMLNILPVGLQVKRDAMLSAYRIRASGQWQRGADLAGHRRIARLLQQHASLAAEPTDLMPREFHFDRRFEISIPDRNEWNEKGEPNDESGICCYTDGSKRGDRLGAGIFIPCLSLEIAEGLDAKTVFLAEIHAIYRCAEIIRERERTKPVLILSDSQAALMALRGNSFRSVSVMRCFTVLQELALTRKVCLMWIPGHCGLAGNERADHLANEATAVAGPLPRGPTPYCTVREQIVRWGAEEHRNCWQRRPDCRQAREFMVMPSRQRAKLLLRLTRHGLSLITQVLTGHNVLNRHLHRMGLARVPWCEQCGDGEETSLHYLTECDAFARCRALVLGGHQVELDHLTHLPPATLLRFINASGRFRE
jgi:ribonuclease HI